MGKSVVDHEGFPRSDWSFEEQHGPPRSGSLDGKDGSSNDIVRILATH